MDRSASANLVGKKALQCFRLAGPICWQISSARLEYSQLLRHFQTYKRSIGLAFSSRSKDNKILNKIKLSTNKILYFSCSLSYHIISNAKLINQRSHHVRLRIASEMDFISQP